MSKIVIERAKLKELINTGAAKYFFEKNEWGHAEFDDCIIREIDTYLAFNNDDDFIGEVIKQENL